MVCWWVRSLVSMYLKNTVFARSDAAATIHFIVQFCVASIRERLLIIALMTVCVNYYSNTMHPPPFVTGY